MLTKRDYVRHFPGLCGPRSWMLALMVLGFLVNLGHAQETIRTLSVTIEGSGKVSGEGDKVLCASGCSVEFEDGEEIVLIATPDAGFRFAAWGGACSETTEICTVVMTQDQLVTATFSEAPPDSPPLLSIRISGNVNYPSGPTAVTSNPEGIHCPPDCSEVYALGTEVTLTAAHPHSDVQFISWDDTPGCFENPVCTVIMTGDLVVTAVFTLENVPVNLDLEVSGLGMVTSSSVALKCPGACSCSGDCRWIFADGDNVILQAIPESAWQFSSWDGACIGQGNPCTISMDGEQPVSVNFTPRPPTLALSLDQQIFLPQDTLILRIQVTPGGNLQQAVDFYLLLQLPDQRFFYYRPNVGFTEEPGPLVSNWMVAPVAGELFRHPFTGIEEPGQYLWVAGFTEPGTPSTIVGAIAFAPFVFSK